MKREMPFETIHLTSWKISFIFYSNLILYTPFLNDKTLEIEILILWSKKNEFETRKLIIDGILNLCHFIFYVVDVYKLVNMVIYHD